MQRIKNKLYGTGACLTLTGIVGGVFGRAVVVTLLAAAAALAGVVALYLGLRYWERTTFSGRLNRYLRQQSKWLRRRSRGAPHKKSVYWVVGPSFSGKTSLLSQSGLVCLQEDVAGDADVDDDSHLAAQEATAPKFWLGKMGLFIELPGVLLEPNSRAQLHSTLRQLRLRGLLRQLKGTLLCIESNALALSKPDVRRLAAPLALMAQMAGRWAPTYLLCTHTDSLLGFAESTTAPPVGQFSGQSGAWGLALDASQPLAPQISGGLRTLSVHLQAAIAKLYNRHPKVAQRQLAYAFPQRVLALGEGLTEVAGSLFEQQRRRFAPYLRGIYFCATDGQASSNWQAQSCATNTLGTFVLTEILPADVHLSCPVQHRGLRGVWQRCGAALVLSCLVSFVMVGQLIALLGNIGLLAATRHAAAAVVSDLAPTSAAGDAKPIDVWLASLDALRGASGQLKRFAAYHTQGTPWYLRFGVYQGRRLERSLADLFARHMQQKVLAPLRAPGEQALRQALELAPAEPQQSAQSRLEYFATTANHLKLYLLLSPPKGADEAPVVDASVGRWLQDALLGQVVPVFAWSLDDADRQLFCDVSTRYLAIFAKAKSVAELRDVDLVRRIRTLLSGEDAADLLLAMWEADMRAEGHLSNLRLDDVLHKIASPLRSSYLISGVYTKEGFELHAKAYLDAQAGGGDAWVLAPRPLHKEMLRRHAQLMQKRYEERYIATWQQMLDSITYAAPRDVAQALAGVVDLTRHEPSALRRLFLAVAHHTQLSADEASDFGAHIQGGFVGDLKSRFWHAMQALTAPSADASPSALNRRTARAPKHGIEQASAPFVRFGVNADADNPKKTALDAYQQQLIGVRQALQNCAQDARESDNCLRIVQQAQVDASELIAQTDGAQNVKPRLERLLVAPLQSIAKSLARGARVFRVDSYCASVVEPFAALRYSYPFDAAGFDAPLADVLSFFRPETGLLWRYYNTELAQDILAVGEHFGFDSRLGGAMRLAYASELLDYLGQAQSVTRALFADGSEGMSFEVRLKQEPDIERLDFEVSGIRVPYGTQEWTPMQWPGPKPSQGAQLVVTSYSGMKDTLRHDGPWGLFRLLESGQLRGEAETGRFTVQWPLAAQKGHAALEVRTFRRQNLLMVQSGRMSFLGALRGPKLVPPARVAQGVASCKAVDN